MDIICKSLVYLVLGYQAEQKDGLQADENRIFFHQLTDSSSGYNLRYTPLQERDLEYPPKTDIASASYSGIPRQSLPSAVADKLRDQIIRGEIPEGAQLRQDAIATQYQVSRIPVREALRQLDAEGLIAIVPNRGAIVPALSPQ